MKLKLQLKLNRGIFNKLDEFTKEDKKSFKEFSYGLQKQILQAESTDKKECISKGINYNLLINYEDKFY